MKKLAALLIGFVFVTSCDKSSDASNVVDIDQYIQKVTVLNHGHGHRYSVDASISSELQAEEVDNIMKQVALYVVMTKGPGSVAVNAFDPSLEGMKAELPIASLKYAPNGDWTSYDLENIESYKFTK